MFQDYGYSKTDRLRRETFIKLQLRSYSKHDYSTSLNITPLRNLRNLSFCNICMILEIRRRQLLEFMPRAFSVPLFRYESSRVTCRHITLETTNQRLASTVIYSSSTCSNCKPLNSGMKK